MLAAYGTLHSFYELIPAGSDQVMIEHDLPLNLRVYFTTLGPKKAAAAAQRLKFC
jgi:hypothetical protein